MITLTYNLDRRLKGFSDWIYSEPHNFYRHSLSWDGGNPMWKALTNNPSKMTFFGSYLGLFLVILLTPEYSECNLAAKRYRSTCDTNPSEIHLTKGNHFSDTHLTYWFSSFPRNYVDEYSASGILTRTCEENVAVNKCEGECASSIYPSALNSVGFHKVWESKVLKTLLECTKSHKIFFFLSGTQK